MAEIPLGATIETVTIPELPEHVLPLSLDDLIPIWCNETGETNWTTLQKIRFFVASSGNSDSYTPVITGNTIIYVVPPEKEGDDFVNIPQLAGLNFKLSRDATTLIPGDEYEVLNTGGFKVLPSIGSLIEGQRFELAVYELATGSSVASGGSGEFISGKILVNTNINVSASNSGKVHKIRGGANSLTLTLPDVDMVPENAVFMFEAIISNQKQHKILTSSGQYIYLNDESVDHLWIGKGEVLWLLRDDDGWYVEKGYDNYLDFGEPKPAYKAGLNRVECLGQPLNRVDYPRLWEFAQTLGSSLVSESTWQTASTVVDGVTVPKPYRGCFSSGDGTTTFRIPDLSNVVLRGLKNYPGTDSERAYNHSGGFQQNGNKNHFHFSFKNADASSGQFPSERGTELSDTRTPIKSWSKTSGGGAEGYVMDSSASEADIGKTSSQGGTEARMDNVGVRFFIKY